MSYWGFRPYVPVAKRRAQAAKEVARLKKQGRAVAPVVVEGRKIAKNFWGKAWCDNLELYSDYENRLPRGRTYVNSGSVVDLQISRGKVEALVSGSDLYEVKIGVAVTPAARWKAICKDCAGSVGSLVELLQGKLSKNVMERVCRQADGLFPTPREIRMSCSCPDWADMCKHVAATLYGVGARLDSNPDLLFTLRGVKRDELIAKVGADLPLTVAPANSERLLADDDVAALFGLDMAEPPTPLARKAGGLKQAKAAAPVESPDPAKKPARRRAATTPAEREMMAGAALRPAPTAQKQSNVKSVADQPSAQRSAARTAKSSPTLEVGDGRAAPERRGVAAHPVSRTRVAKWIGARARKKDR